MYDMYELYVFSTRLQYQEGAALKRPEGRVPGLTDRWRSLQLVELLVVAPDTISAPQRLEPG
jgi:hypothetical protein